MYCVQSCNECKNIYKNKSIVLPANDAFDWSKPFGWNEASILHLFSSGEFKYNSKLIKFQGWPANRIFDKFSRDELTSNNTKISNLFLSDVK